MSGSMNNVFWLFHGTLEGLGGSGAGGLPLYPPLKIQIFVLDFPYEFSEKVSCCLPVASHWVCGVLKAKGLVADLRLLLSLESSGRRRGKLPP